MPPQSDAESWRACIWRDAKDTFLKKLASSSPTHRHPSLLAMRNHLTHRKKRRFFAVLRRRLGGMSLLLLYAYLPKESSFLTPAGLIASLQRQWMIEIGVVLIAVLVPIFIALPAIIWRYRISNRKTRYAPD